MMVRETLAGVPVLAAAPAPPSDGAAVTLHISGTVTTIALVAAVLFAAYAALTSQRVGVRVAWRRLGYSVLGGVVIAACVIGWFYKAEPVKLARGAQAYPGGLHAELVAAGAGLAAVIAMGLFILATVAGGRRGPRRPRRSRRRAAPVPLRPPGGFGSLGGIPPQVDADDLFGGPR